MLFIIILNDTYCILMLITEVLNMENLRNTMGNFHLDCLDQLILVVHLPDVSVSNTNYLL